MVEVPQRLTFVTLGPRDMRRRRAFYAEWGWREREGSDDEFTAFQLGSVRLALYPLDLLGVEAAPDAPPPGGDWNGVTLAVNVPAREDVEAVFEAAARAGAQVVAAPVDREWGGFSGYVADVEGQRWEIAWLPGFVIDDR